MSTLREALSQIFAPTVSPAEAPIDNVPERIREAIAERDRAGAALNAARAERQALQTAHVGESTDMPALMDAFVSVDRALVDAEESLRQAQARVDALERVGHQVLLQRRREEQATQTAAAKEAGERLRNCDAREAALGEELKAVRAQRQRAVGEVDVCTRRAAAAALSGIRRFEAAFNNGLSRDRVPSAMPVRLSEWMRVWDGAHAIGVEAVEFNVDIDSGLVHSLVRPNELPGFRVTINAQRLGEVQR